MSFLASSIKSINVLSRSGSPCAIIQYVLKWSSILLNIYLTIKIVITLNRISGVDELETKKLKSLATRMLSFPLIQLLAAILLTI